MNVIFLRAKHWQLFIPLLVIPFVTLIVAVIAATVIIDLVENNTDQADEMLWTIYFLPVIFILCGFIQFVWFWNVLTKLNALIPSDKVRMPIRRIKLFFFIPISYFCLIPLFIVFLIRNTANPEPAQIMLIISTGIIAFVVHLFSMFCMVHTIYFSAKTIRAAELKRQVTFSDFAADFFLIWFFPIGIWFIQPRVNKLADEANRVDLTDGITDQF